MYNFIGGLQKFQNLLVKTTTRNRVHRFFTLTANPTLFYFVRELHKTWTTKSQTRTTLNWHTGRRSPTPGTREKDKQQQKVKRVALFQEKPMNNLESRAVGVGRWSEVWSNIAFQAIHRQIHPTVTQIRHQVVPQMEGASELKTKRTVTHEKYITVPRKPNPVFTNTNHTQPTHRNHQWSRENDNNARFKHIFARLQSLRAWRKAEMRNKLFEQLPMALTCFTKSCQKKIECCSTWCEALPHSRNLLLKCDEKNKQFLKWQTFK